MRFSTRAPGLLSFCLQTFSATSQQTLIDGEASGFRVLGVELLVLETSARRFGKGSFATRFFDPMFIYIYIYVS